LQRNIVFNFSHVFDGVIWNTKVSSQHETIVLEVRNSDKKEVRFTALNYGTNEVIWKDKILDEAWWIGLSAVTENFVLFTHYTDTNNPDKKAILAYSLRDAKLVWWSNDFSIQTVSDGYVTGFSEKYGRRDLVLDIYTGNTVNAPEPESELPDEVLRPHQYLSDHFHFETIKTFFNQKFNLLPITALEYLEYDSLILISCYLHENDLANYLFILSSDGDLLLKEKLDEHLKGIGLDTFFILSGCVFFVKNRRELVSYKIL
jgi:hypothetical protein